MSVKVVIYPRLPSTFLKMTRVNLVDPAELANQHLFAEFRELKMIPKALARSLKTQSVDKILKKIPNEFTLNTGHVLFFYDKGEYLRKRYELLKEELIVRGYNFNQDSKFDPDDVMFDPQWNGDYKPDERAFAIIRERIAEKIALRPNFYTWTKKN
jgi:deoxyribonuclease (pyrimidine dimer)